MLWKTLHQFWFDDISISQEYYARQIKRWFFRIDAELDRDCRERFAPHLWRLEQLDLEVSATPQENLAKIILLDQIPRNSFRGSSKAYMFDHMAQKLALNSLGTHFETDLSLVEKIFLYMPFEHAENTELQDLSVIKFHELHELAPEEIKEWTKLGLQKALDHRETLVRHGRFPGRTEVAEQFS